MRLTPQSISLLTAASVLISTSCSEYEYHTFDGQDAFIQVEAAEVDVLLMVDNSCSMEPYQEKLSENFDTFLTFFLEGNVDYQIGVVTTTVVEPIAYGACSEADVAAVPAPGELVDGTYVTLDTDDADEVFADLVKVGTCGSGSEMGLESAYRAVTEPMASNKNDGFLREDAYLSVIFISDEQDASPLPVNDYINAFREVKGQRNRDIFNASSLVVTNVDDCSLEQQQSGATKGTRYMDVANQTDGILDSICADDFDSIITELSLASSRLTDTFYLSDLPKAGSLVVGVDGEEIPCEDDEWTYELQEIDDEPTGTIIFDRENLPPTNSRITVVYDLGNGDEGDFCVSSEDE